MKKPPYLYTLTPRWGADVQALLTALGGTAILGVNLEQDPKINSKIADRRGRRLQPVRRREPDR